MKSPIKAVLFDLDGVLINSLPVMKMALGAALAEVYPKRNFDIDMVFMEYRKYLGMGFKQIMQKMELSELTYEPFRKHSRYLAPYVTLYGSVEELLSQCAAQQLTLGIATGKDYERTIELLKQLRIDHYFSQVITSDRVENPKPAADMVEVFCQQQGLKPEQVLLVGDAQADLECGQAAGCQVAAAAWGYSSYKALWALSPDYLFASADDALQQVLSLTTAQEDIA